MRGKGSAPPRGHPLPGITPAYAGKSNALLNLPAGQRDHPRVCGEKEAAALSEVYETGSPPRMRGKGTMKTLAEIAERITPAYAGKSCPQPIILWSNEDHPRVCGEKWQAWRGAQPLSGSPPRMRGKEGQPGRVERGTGITPAYAGKRPRAAQHWTTFQDHPRVCGEKHLGIIVQTGRTGSPPRMRGKVGASRPSWPPAGITPAYAGKSGCCNPDP